VTAVVWVVRPGDDNEQLRYSMRSVASNLPHDSVWIAGHKPKWVSDKVHHLPTDQAPGDRHGNVRKNITAACHALDEWLCMWDDIFVTRPIPEVPVLHRGTVTELVAEKSAAGEFRSYERDIQAAGQVLERLGYEQPLCYDCLHVPQAIRSPDMLKAIQLAEQHQVKMVLTLHGNLVQVGGEKAGNAKADTGWSRRVLVSTSARRWLNAPVGAYIRDLFPEPCDYEK
jgi:hypothetical protein